ncbi:DNA (cytosine-5-)-methyltransferase [Rhodovulum sulfidophilum]|uniref:DNA (cytosine-5-)-methyltransferase n=1 Tax=Rhodovulum sulfidophilum TaxID=35806 RepID=A0A0D6B6Z5_RHOSU|nr:DNA (cytosine-5-)-methyltransferase [Rhodovulum sulfidophilum]
MADGSSLLFDFAAERPADPRPMIIDSFAGGGGASTGIEMALGRSPDVAINHSGPALALHHANHPETLHLNSNIWDADPLSVTGGRHVGLLWASPDCKHFSKAKGAALCDRNIRDLAWVVVRWAEEARPDVICMENVEEFVTWGPVGEDGRPIREFAGMTYELWVKRLRKAGYKVKWRELRACDYGAPTIRKRWFCVARRDGRPIAWPAPTHGDPASPAVRKGRLLPWRAAADCIDWSLPCPSIFDSSAEIMARHGLRAVRPLAKNTLARIARGMRRYVLDAERPFIVNLTHGARTEDLARPLRTITGANRGEKALVVPSLTRFNGGATGADLRDPMPTVTANSWIKRPGGAMPLGIVTPHLLSLKGSARRDGAATAPHPTVLAGGGHSAVVAPVLTYAQQGGGNRTIADPHHTICASKKDQNSLLAATMVHVGNGERPGQAPRALDIGAPLNTVVAGGVKQYPVAAFLAQQNGGPRMDAHAGHDPRAPLSTVAASGSHQTPVAAWFAKYYGTGDGARMDAPCHTVTVKDRMGHMQADLAAPPFAREHEARAREVAEFLRAHGAWDGGAFVTLEIDGQSFVVIDIGMRMLSPRELFNAQGFPPDYVIEGAWEGLDSDAPTFRPFSKDVQISCCGNSVCPPVAAAIIAANCKHLAEKQRETA